MSTAPLRTERGIALPVVILMTMMVIGLATTALMMTTNGRLMRKANERIRQADLAALSGLEEARSRINGTPSLYPDTGGYTTIENGVTISDASGTAIPGARRWTYVGPAGVSTGQYGVFGAIVTKTTVGNVTSVRQRAINQETFAKFAYFTNDEGPGICFGSGDQIQGPVHSNDQICINSGGATFTGKLTTAASSISGQNYGTYSGGYTLSAQAITMPTIAQLTAMASYAQAGGTYFDIGVAHAASSHTADVNGRTAGDAGEARTRVEFVSIDLNADGDSVDADEGFFRVYMGTGSGSEDYVSGSTPPDNGSTHGMRYSPNCGDVSGNHSSQFQAAADHGSGTHNWAASLSDNAARCYLGGDPALTNGWVASNSKGKWIQFTTTPDSRLVTLNRPDRNFLFPLHRSLNVNFKGVIYVNGKVGVSGVVRGRVSIVSPNSIIVLDDVRQASDPGTGICDDILGLITTGNVVLSNDVLTAPQVKNTGGTLKTFDETGSEFIQAVILALGIFTVENYDSGPTSSTTGRENCESTNWGRGCLYLTGGVVQETRGAVGLSDGSGYKKRYSYNACAGTNPPPYFPTTGRFEPNRIYEIDPTGFDVAAWYAANQD
jgi:Tfp pilus assembly protein PilX